MSEIEIVVRTTDGTETDITEAVKVMYDVVHASMDWGSGFLDTDEMAQVIALAEACGFQAPDLPYGHPYRAASFYRKEGEPLNEHAQRILDRAKDIRAMFRSVPVVKR